MYWFTCVSPGNMVEHSFTINLVIQGYYVYKDGWDTLIIGEVFYCEREIMIPPYRPVQVVVKSATLKGALLILFYFGWSRIANSK